MAITATKFFATEPAQLAPDVEDRFFTDLKTANNTFKRTAHDRFVDLDLRCIDLFRRAHADVRQVLDVGISSGATTLALHERLRQGGFRPAITGTDIALSAWLVPLRRGLRVLVDEGAHPLQYEIAGRAVRAWTRRADYVTGRAALAALLRAATRAPLRARLQDNDPAIRKVMLVSPRLRGQTSVKIEQNDIFVPTPAFRARFDFIRIANVLNSGYFGEAQLRRGLSHAMAYLRGPGSWLLLARTRGARNAATLFRVAADGSRLEVAARFHGGSEVEALALSQPVPPRWSRS